MKKIGRIILLSALVVLSASCHRRPLVDLMEQVLFKVTIDVDTVANIKRHIYNEQIEKPSTNTDMLRVMVYDKNTHKLLTQNFLSDKSYDAAGHQVFTGNVRLSYGDFDFLIYNFDTPNTLIKEENNEDAIQAYTSQAPQSILPAAAGSKADDNTYMGSVIHYQPDHLMVARERDYHIAPHAELTTIETTAYTVLNTYYIQIHVEGLQYVSSCNAVISGLYSGNQFGLDSGMKYVYGKPVSNPSAAVYFKLEKSTDKNIAGENKDVLCALFNTFGKIEEQSSDLYVNFNVVDTEGNLLTKQVSLDRIFKTEDAIERHWLLIDEAWSIPNPKPNPVGGGGFQPVVDDWEEQQGEIVL